MLDKSADTFWMGVLTNINTLNLTVNIKLETLIGIAKTFTKRICQKEL